MTRYTSSTERGLNLTAVVALFALALLGPTTAFAQLKFSVNSTGDAADFSTRNGVCETAPGNGVCTLRAAIHESNAQVGSDSIGFRIPTSDPNYNAATGVWTIPLLTALPSISEGVQITGPGADKLTVRRADTSLFRIFDVTASGTVGLTGMTIAFGFDTSSLGGAGIRKFSAGTLNINACVIMGNIGGGVLATGTVNVINSTFRQNVNAVPGEQSGGGIYNYSGTITVTNSTFFQNHSSAYGGAIFNDDGDATITGSVFYENGAGYFGGALANRDGTLTISNSTFFANIAYAPSSFGASGVGGGISNDGDGVISISNSTVTANYSGTRGGGLYNQGGAVTVKSTIVADNRGSMVTGNPDVFGTFLSQGFNLIGKKDGSTGFTASTDKKSTIAAPLNPKFDVKGLRNNGGPTLTIGLASGSPAIDKATSLGLTGILSTDQRGSGFLRKVDKATANATGGDGTNIGAYELQ